MNSIKNQKQDPVVPQHPTFNNQYEIVKSLGEGNTSKVYLGRKIGHPTQFVAIKLLKEEFLKRENDSLLSVQNEITILKNMQHNGIVRMLDFGDKGSCIKPSGRLISDLVYITMEYISGGLLFDMC